MCCDMHQSNTSTCWSVCFVLFCCYQMGLIPVCLVPADFKWVGWCSALRKILVLISEEWVLLFDSSLKTFSVENVYAYVTLFSFLPFHFAVPSRLILWDIFMKFFEFRGFTSVTEVHQWHVNNSSVIAVGYNLYMEMDLWVIGS